MTSLSQSPVLVAGAGPTGLTLALLLHRQGVDVRIVERAPQPAVLSKALAVWSASLEVFAGLGLAEQFVNAGNPLRSIRLGDKGKLLATVPMDDGVDSAFPQPVLLPQSRTEAILRSQAEQEGIRIEYGIELRDLTQDSAGVTVTLAGPNANIESARFAYVVGADGARSTVRSVLNIAFEGYTEPQTFILGDVQISGRELDANSIHIWWDNGGTVALFPTGGDARRIMGVRENSDPGDTQSAPTLDELQQLASRHGPPGLRLVDHGWLSAFTTNKRLASQYRVGRVFVAGDAAHIHSPAGGQGMNTGIQDAANLSWKLAAAIHGRGDTELLLSSYESERRPVAEKVVKESAQRLHLMSATGAIATAVRDVAVSLAGRLSAVQRKVQVELSETDLTYLHGPLVDLASHTHHVQRGDVGTRALDIAISGDGDGDGDSLATLWSTFDGVRHTLLMFKTPDDAANDLHTVIARYEASIHVVTLDRTREDHQASFGRYRIDGAGWVLIRPDMVVAARGSSRDVSTLNAYLRAVMAQTEPA